jgi:FMN phosphatase YigB (HAD superfamily)
MRRGPRRVFSEKAGAYHRALREAEAVTFDVFDTALCRCVPEPSDVFEIVALRLCARDSCPVDAPTFRRARIEAETRVRAAAAARGILEVTLREIYDELKMRLPDLDERFAYAEEIDVERAVSFANVAVRRLYESALRAGKRVIFISDTYFPHDVVAELLARAGYAGPHTIFASCESRRTKESGTLFAHVARACGIDPRRMLHLGDNPRADVEMARRSNVVAYWFGGGLPRARSSPGQPLAERVVARLCAVLLETTECDPARRLGIEVLGPIFLGFTQWMMNRIRDDDPDLVLFFARDGAFLLSAFERLCREWPGPLRRYFYASRRALIVPSIRTLDERALLTLTQNHAAVPVTTFFSRIGIDIDAYPADLAAVGLTPDSIVHDGKNVEALRALFARVEPAILERAARERPLLLEYLEQTGVLAAAHVGVVDIGWGGTMQDALAAATSDAGRAIRYTGYYVSTDERIDKMAPAAGEAKGFLANAGAPHEIGAIVGTGYWLLEIAATADHGTTLGYERDDDGTVRPILQSHDPTTPHARTALALATAALDLIDRWAAIYGGPGPEIGRDAAFARLRRFVENPTMAEAKLFGDLIHVGGLGTTREDTPIAKPPSLGAALRDPRDAIERYRRSHWQTAFIARATGIRGSGRAALALRAWWRSLRDRSANVRPDRAGPTSIARSSHRC